MRYHTGGESHGRALVALVTDVPAGIPVDQAAIDADLARRQAGYGRGGRQRIETDRATVLSGVRFGKTLGGPVALSVANRDWENWLDVMPSAGEKPAEMRESWPRPGHADLSGMLKYDTDDARDILERASARETAARVAAGGIAKALLRAVGVDVLSAVVSIGDVESSFDIEALDRDAIEASVVRCPDAEATERMKVAIDSARADGDTLGGVVVVVATGLVPGLGTHVEADRRLDARIAAAMCSIPAIKGVEFGDGFDLARASGSRAHDAIHYDERAGLHRKTNHAGGLEGGMTNGEHLVVRVAMKPIPTLMRPLASVDFRTLEPVDASKERSDVCAVPAAGVVAEAELALVLADAYLDKFGHDTLADILTALDAYRQRIAR